jgi:predicted Zn finger-like uncharacterized protein
VVVQCPDCQSKFRIADEKVTDRGVRVRCTSCKNVFQVRKPGAGPSESAPGPGTTMDLSALGAAAVAKSGSTGPVKTGSTGPVKTGSTGPVKTGSTGPVKTGSTGPVKSGAAARPSTGPVKPATGPVRPSTDKVRTGRSEATPARRLDADDLFGMAELTGDAPLSTAIDPPVPPPAPEPAPAVAKPAAGLPGFDDLELEIDAPPKAARPPPPPPPDVAEPPPAPLDPPMPPVASLADSLIDAGGPMALDDRFTAPGGAATAGNGAATEEKPARVSEARPRTDPVRPRTDPVARRDRPPKAETIAEPEIAPARALISSAITGLLGAALAIAVVIASALSDDSAAGWLGFGTAVDLIPTGVVSGLYDTAGGKPVFFVRGRVENRSKKVRGPVRVTAELVADGASEAKADAIAGSEPSPEDVWSLRSAADAEKLTRTLQSARVDRSIAPGASLPFFALIPDPPADLVKHRLQVRVETAEAWKQPGTRSARNR